MLRIAAVLLLAFAAPGIAVAQDQPAVDPATALTGLWRVDKVEGDYDTAAALIGRVMRIDRDAVASLTGGTCSNPGFAPDPAVGGIAVTCLGQRLATADWQAGEPDTLQWAEPNVQAVLHRISGENTGSTPDQGSAAPAPADSATPDSATPDSATPDPATPEAGSDEGDAQ